MPKCSKCGEEVLASDAQCMSCGTALARRDSRPSTPGRSVPPARPSPSPAVSRPRRPGQRAGQGPAVPWKTVAWLAVGVVIIVAGAVYFTRKAPVSALDGVWETADQESVLYVDTQARTITYEGPAPVQVRTEIYSSSSSDGSRQVVEGTRTQNTTIELRDLTITQRPGASFLIVLEDATTDMKARLKGRNGLQIRTASKGSLRGLARDYRRQ
jgi:hypothetical protein